MLSTTRLFLLGALLVVSGAQAQRAPRAEKYQDPDVGLSLSLPGEWTRVPQDPKLPWVAARFIADTARLQPEFHAGFTIVVLPQDEGEARKVLTIDPGDPYVIRPEGKGWQTYAAFVEATTEDFNKQGKKFEVAVPVAGKSAMGPHEDFTAWSRLGGWTRRRARVFERSDMKVAIELTLPDPRKDDLEPLWQEILSSVRPFAMQGVRTTPEPWLSYRLNLEDQAAWLALPAAKRRDLRTRSEERWTQAVKSRSHPPWRCSASKRFTVVAVTGVAEAKYVEKLEVFAGWLDRTLGALSDDKVRRFVLRICSDMEQRDVFECRPGPTTGFTEVVMFSIDDPQSEALSYGAAHQAMFWTYLHDKNPLLGHVLPLWLEKGLSRSLYYASRVRGSEVAFEGDDWGRDHARQLMKDGKLAPLRTLLTHDTAALRAYWSKQDSMKVRVDVQCGLATAFLLSKQPLSQLQDFLPRYLAALTQACAGIGAVTDQDERRRLLDAAYEKVNAQVFGSDDDVWRRIEKAYADYVRG